MARRESARRLIVNADDFGRSHSINAAVIRAHDEGILTTASLMVGEPGFEEAVALARAHPRLGVGLHLALLGGHAVAPPEQIPGLVDACGCFPENPVRAGFRYFFSRPLRPQLEKEIEAQFERFHRTGLKLDHVNGHLHLHLHPVVFGILTRNARRWGIGHLRLTRDPFGHNATLAAGRWLYRGSHALIFGLLARRAFPALQAQAIRHTDRVYGLLQHARVDELYVTALLGSLPGGVSELYSHPSLDDFKAEFDALISPGVRARVTEQGIQLIRYQDL
jgi:chitin disaccharide deacetylase